MGSRLIILVALSVVLLTGCGTMINTVTGDGRGSGVPPRVIYGGVRTNAAALAGHRDAAF